MLDLTSSFSLYIGSMSKLHGIDRWINSEVADADEEKCGVQEGINSGKAPVNQHETLENKEQDVTELCSNTRQLTPLEVAEFTDPTTQALIRTREDLLLSVSYPSGEKILEHQDGTRVTLQQNNWKVESIGLPVINSNPSGVFITPSPGIARPSEAQSVKAR